MLKLQALWWWQDPKFLVQKNTHKIITNENPSYASMAKDRRASPVVLNMWSCNVQKNARLAQKNSFWLHIKIAQFLWWLAESTANSVNHEKSVINKIDLTAAQCFWLVHHNDWFRMVFAISSSPPPICCTPSFSFMGGVAAK